MSVAIQAMGRMISISNKDDQSEQFIDGLSNLKSIRYYLAYSSL